jgi:hypothetical protein
MEETMTDLLTIRRRRDGSIDAAHFLKRARCCRSKAAHEMASQATKKTRSVLVALNAFLAFPALLGGKGRRASADDAGS